MDSSSSNATGYLVTGRERCVYICKWGVACRRQATAIASLTAICTDTSYQRANYYLCKV